VGTEISCERRSEVGDTLIEVLIAVVIVGLIAVALLGALTTSLSSSADHRYLATMDTVLKSYGETARYDIELQPNAWYQPCPSWASSPPTYDVPSNRQIIVSNPLPDFSNYQIVLQSPTYFDPVGNRSDGTTCVPKDLQVLTFSASRGGISQTLSVVVRNPT
jgi:type II secretory pathway pseudopilin PulG